MNAFRTISRVFVVAAVVAVGAARASESGSGLGSAKAPLTHSKQALEIVKGNICTALAIAAATEVSDDNDIAKAAVETVGVLADQAIAGEINPAALAFNFGVNLGARYTGGCFAANGFEVPNPKFDNRVAKHTVAPLSEALRTATPQMVAGLTVMCLSKAGYL